MNQRQRRILMVSALILAAIAGVTYKFRSPPPMNVLLITLDTTRADRLGCYGYNEALTPAMDSKSMKPIDCYSATDDPFLHEGWSPLRSLTTERWKYIRTTRPELFDLRNDPQEMHNLAESNVQQLKAMELSLSQMEQRMVAQASSNVQLSERELRILQSLGYVGQSDPDQPVPTSDSPLLDIKDMLQYDVDARAAFNLMQTGQLDKAITSLQEIVSRSPAS